MVGENGRMKIITQTPIEQLVADPFRDKRRSTNNCNGHIALAQTPEWRERLERLEEALLQGETFELPVEHYFSRGVYGRYMDIPKGVTITGRIHKYSQINVLIRGEVSVLTEDGVVQKKAPFIVVSPPGTKRAVYAHEDSTWMTFCGTEHTDTNTIVDLLTTRTYEEYDSFCAQKLNAPNDYELFLSEWGLTQEQVEPVVVNVNDQIPFDPWVMLEVRDSAIHGQGMFLTQNASAGTIIAPIRVNGFRTPAGRYTNHAKEPNCLAVRKRNGDIDLVAKVEIGAEQEATIDYRQIARINHELVNYFRNSKHLAGESI